MATDFRQIGLQSFEQMKEDQELRVHQVQTKFGIYNACNNGGGVQSLKELRQPFGCFSATETLQVLSR